MKKYFTSILLGFLLIACARFNDSETLQLEKAVAIVELENTKLLASVVADGLEVPWEITLGPQGWLWYTEQKGTISRVQVESRQKQLLKKIEEVHFKKSRGLLSMVLHPNFEQNPFVFVHYTYAYLGKDLEEITESRIVRFTFQEDTLISPFILLDSIPGKPYHNGSRMVISPDYKLYFSSGDAGNAGKAQDPNVLSGKILRLNLDGSIPNDNPIPNNPVWTWGHRNAQGLVWANGKLYASEHGTITNDEINLIQKGGNYGWNRVEGFCDLPKEQQYCQDSTIIEPLKSWTPTLGIAGLDYYSNEAIPEWSHSLVSVNLKGQALRILTLDEIGEKIVAEKIYFQKQFGRIRDVAVAPNGDLFFSTSNTDWHPRYQPWMYDSLPEGSDRIIRLSPANASILASAKSKLLHLSEDPVPIPLLDENWDYKPPGSELAMGEQLYKVHCAACHRSDGTGAEGLIPPLVETDWVDGDRFRLIKLMLNGLSEPIEVNGILYDQEMPAYDMLEDEQIAAIINYIRSSFGNNARGVTVAEVEEERRHGM